MANIVDFANQIKTYMRGAEVVASKNLFNPNGFYTPKTTTVNGGTVTNNGDGSYTINGTVTSNSDYFITQSSNGNNNPQSYLISDYSSLIKMDNIASMDMSTPVSGCYFRLNMRDSSDGFVQDIDASDPTSITIPQNATKFRLKIWIPAGTYNDFTVYPMITDASETDQTYMPYFEPLKDSKLAIADQQVLGAWNLLRNNATSTEVNGVTFTKNTDGSITVNGTATANISYNIELNHLFKANKKYILSGLNNGTRDRFCLTVLGGTYQSYNGEVEISYDSDVQKNVLIYIAKDFVINNITIYPMISLEPNLPYVPYAMTNSELTEKVQEIINAVTNASDFSAFKTAIGNL